MYIIRTLILLTVKPALMSYTLEAKLDCRLLSWNCLSYAGIFTLFIPLTAKPGEKI